MKLNEWENYFDSTRNAITPEKTLLLACQYFHLENPEVGKAADLGAGTGRDTLFLLKKGWHVCAIDVEPSAIDIILSRVDAGDLSNLEAVVSSFSEMTLPKELNLINASYSLPFCKPEEFNLCWNKVIESLAVGGRFCGHFFGEDDQWANDPNLTILTNNDLIKLFETHFEIEYLQIKKGMIPCASGVMKHSHLYHVVAKKIH